MHEKDMRGYTVKIPSEDIHSRILLQDREQDLKIQEYLKKYIVGCQGSLALYSADHGQFSQSLRCDLQVLTEPLYWPQVRVPVEILLEPL
jgi:hypothetical protein